MILCHHKEPLARRPGIRTTKLSIYIWSDRILKPDRPFMGLADPMLGLFETCARAADFRSYDNIDLEEIEEAEGRELSPDGLTKKDFLLAWQIEMWLHKPAMERLEIGPYGPIFPRNKEEHLAAEEAKMKKEEAKREAHLDEE